MTAEASGTSKDIPIRAALTGKYMNVPVTDDSAAKCILDMVNEPYYFLQLEL